ncbi:hypothetical protein [Roseibium sp. M-1]
MRKTNLLDGGHVDAPAGDDSLMALPHVLLDLPGNPASIENLCRSSDVFRDICEDYCHFRIILNSIEEKAEGMLSREVERYQSFVDNAASHILNAIDVADPNENVS